MVFGFLFHGLCFGGYGLWFLVKGAWFAVGVFDMRPELLRLSMSAVMPQVWGLGFGVCV